MNPIAVFYHCRISGGDPPVDFDHGSALMTEQMTELKVSGLSGSARHIYVGVNGGEEDFTVAACLAPVGSKIQLHPRGSRGELPTLHVLQEWLPGHDDWHVLYHHTKGAMYKNNAHRDAWRRRMQHAVVTNWRRCVNDLEKGAEAVGCHWLTPEQYPGLVGSPYFGGNFWWAKASYLKTLPILPESTWENRYEAEAWVGKAAKRPKIVDYHPGWP